MSDFDSARFRQVLGHFPTGVTVVTGMDGDRPVGLTIGSFTSVSLDPPLVGFLPMVTSASWQAMRETGRFCVNVLGDTHGDLCWKFAKSSADVDAFDGLSWSSSPTGSPIIDGVIAWIDCTVEATYEMGDHLFVLGRVHAMDARDDDPTPLLFYRGKLGGFHLI